MVTTLRQGILLLFSTCGRFQCCLTVPVPTLALTPAISHDERTGSSTPIPEEAAMRFRSSVLVALLLTPALARAQAEEPLLLQKPTVSATHIVFAFADDLWTVPRAGGEAQRLTSGPG